MDANTIWNGERAKYYLKRYGDPRDKKGSQSQICRDASSLLIPGPVLDVACGIGHLIPFILDRVKEEPKELSSIPADVGDIPVEYTGIDMSLAMLTQAKLLFPNLLFYPKDARDFDLSSTYKNVVCISLLLHLTRDDMNKVLACMWRHVAPDGVMVFGMETLGDTERMRGSGLLLRNQPVDEVLKDLELLDGPCATSWIHQKIGYQTISEVMPSRDLPLSLVAHNPISRTTLFKIERLSP